MPNRSASPTDEKDKGTAVHHEHRHEHVHHENNYEFHNNIEEYGGDRGFWGNVNWQLETWHAGRGDRSIAASIIPWPTQALQHDDLPGNPLKLLSRLSFLGWASFFCGWLCWMCDGYDYFSVPITETDLEKYFNRPAKDITWAMTVTTLCRVVGAIGFGLLSDRYGRRYTLTLNMTLIMVFELASGFVKTYPQFLALRAVFGMIMGGTWPLAVATALENVPVEARGFVSGLVQQGYAIGNMLTAVIAMTVGHTSPHGWRTLFWFGAGFSALAAFVRFIVPESKLFVEAQKQAKEEGMTDKEAARHMLTETRKMLKTNWIRCVWCVLVMAGFCFLAHGSQDLYATYLKKTKGLPAVQASKIVIISNCGAVVGGLLGGSASQYFGRRFTIILSIIWTGAFIPLWVIPNSFSGLAVGGFFMQWGVQSAWGVVPVYLSEVSPPAFRALFLGLFYQLGNMASGASGQIEAVVGEHVKLKGTNIPDYAKIQAVFVGIVLGCLLICVLLGPEAQNSHFEKGKVAFQKGAGEVVAAQLVDEDEFHHGRHGHHHGHEKERQRSEV